MTAVYVVGYWRAGHLLPLSGPLATVEEARDLLGRAIASAYAGRLGGGLVTSLGVAKVSLAWLANQPSAGPALEAVAA